ncbi:DedA family protein [Salinispora pacifica]|uniref:DedA family protein n=1 Tax=Salinispora pacifica TaxID=351187 RepID=UPI00036195F7|nr:VTT domain-containing protein [Salinispora pacifica]
MLDHVLPLISSPWIFALVAATVAVDGVVPVLPAETLVIALGALAAHGRPAVAALIAAAAVGSFAGDQLAYRLGLRATSVVAKRGGRLYAAVSALRRYGDVAVVLGRFLPGGRTATALAAGSAGFSRRRFAIGSAVGSVGWAFYIVGLGYLGGTAFHDRPLLAMLPGVLAGLTIAATTRILVRRGAGREPSAARESSAVGELSAVGR